MLQNAQNYSQRFVDDMTRRGLDDNQRGEDLEAPALKKWSALDDDPDFNELREQYDSKVAGENVPEAQRATNKAALRLKQRDAFTRLYDEAVAQNPEKAPDKDKIYIDALKAGYVDFKNDYTVDQGLQGEAEAAAALTPEKQFAAYATTVAKEVTQATRAERRPIHDPFVSSSPEVLRKWQESNPGKTWDMLSVVQRQQELNRSVQTLKGPDGKFYTPRQATAEVRKWLKTARTNAKSAGPLEPPDKAPATVPVTKAEQASTERPPSPAQQWAGKVLDNAVDYIQEDLSDRNRSTGLRSHARVV